MYLSLKNKLNTLISAEKVICILTVFGVTPVFFIFQMTIIRPKLLKIWGIGFVSHCLHVVLSTFCFINVFGNMIMSIVVNSNLKAWKGQGRYCERCRQTRPADSWHCAKCNACILGRDHHCFFLSQCIGRYNLRYFICFLLHVTISFALSLYYDYCAIASEFDYTSFLDITVYIVHVLRPAYILMNPFFDVKKYLYSVCWYLNVVAFIICGGLLLYHLNNAIRGITSYEYSKGRIPTKFHWRRNLVRVFGTRWYLAVLWPLVDSPLPDKSG